MTWSLEVTHPFRLLGLLGAVVLFYYFYRGLTDFPPWQKRTSLAVRAVILLLLVLALAGLTLSRPTSEQFVIFAVDQSLSVGKESQEQARKYLDEAAAQAGRSKVAFLPFEGEPGKLASKPETLFVPPDEASRPRQAAGMPPMEEPTPATNLEAALEAAVAMVPPGYVPQVVMLSDGNQTRGDALRTSLRAGIPISTVPLPTRKEPEAQVSAVNLPAQVRQGESFFVEVVIDSNHDDEGLIQVYRGDHQVVSEKKALKKGENRFRFPQRIESERLAN